MVGLTHAGLGLLALSLAGPVSGAEAALCVAGSLLPDIDSPGSMAGRLVPGSSWGRTGRAAVGLGLCLAGLSERSAALAGAGLVLAAAGFLGHRGFTHSLAGLACAAALAWQLLGPAWWAFALGWLVHLGADAFTPWGVPVLWPSPKRFGVAVVRTGSLPDRLLGFLALGLGLTRGVR